MPASGGAQGQYVSTGRRKDDARLGPSLWLHFKCIYLFIFGCTRSLLLPRLSLVSANRLLSSCGAQASHCSGFLLGSTALECAWASVVVACRLNCPKGCGILVPSPGIGSVSPDLQADSQPLDHQGRPYGLLLWVDWTLSQSSFWKDICPVFLGAAYLRPDVCIIVAQPSCSN